MKKFLIISAVAIFLFVLSAKPTSATLLGHVGSCGISDTDRGVMGDWKIVQAATLADAEAINNLYMEKWKRHANCEELQRHLDWGTSLDRLAEWLVVDQPNAVIGDCGYPSGTTKDAVENLNNIYLEEAGKNMNCEEMFFHLRGTAHDALRNWIRNDPRFSEYQEWKNSFQLTEGATYRDGTKFWLIQNGQRHWVPDIPTMFSWGLIFEDSTYIPPAYADGFYFMAPEGDQLKFWEGAYKTAVKNRFKGSGYGTIPTRLNEAIQAYRHPSGTWRGWSEFNGIYPSFCSIRTQDIGLGYTIYCSL